MHVSLLMPHWPVVVTVRTLVMHAALPASLLLH